MPIVEMGDGSYMNFPEGTPPQVIARERARTRGVKKPVAAPKLTGEAAEVARIVQERKSSFRNGGAMSGARALAKGFLSNFDDEAAGAISAVKHGIGKAITKGDVSQIGREYRIGRDVIRAENNQLAIDHPVAGTVAEVTGAVFSPLGKGTKALKVVGKPLEKLGTVGARILTGGAAAVRNPVGRGVLKAGEAAYKGVGKVGRGATRFADKLDNAPALVQALAAGSVQGAVNAAGSNENLDTLGGDMVKGGALGGAFGGAMGGATVGLRRGAQIWKDRAPSEAARMAYGRIAQMLERGDITPKQAQRELMVTNARGGDGMVADLTPGLRAQQGAMSRKPNLKQSNAMIERGEQRIDSRLDRFDSKVKESVQPATGQDADALRTSVEGARKAHGEVDYKRVLDGNFSTSPALEKFLREAPDEVHAVLRDGAKLANLFDQDIGKLGARILPDGKMVLEATPSMRVYDYAKRALDARISAAFDSGNKPLATGLSHQLNKFKQHIMDANGEYAPILATQRDLFQKTEALELGSDFIARLRKEPRLVLNELRAIDPSNVAHARTGTVDALLSMRNTKQDPVRFIAQAMKHPEQRRVLEFVFEGRGNLSKFERWLKREVRGARADVLTAPGRQSETARFDMANESFGHSASDIATAAGRGMAYGGSAGLTASVMRKFDDLKNTLSPSAMEEMAKLLMSDGQTLPKGISAAKAYAKRRGAANRRAGVLAAKGGQQLVTGFSSGE
jgi:hypothetical protein